MLRGVILPRESLATTPSSTSFSMSLKTAFFDLKPVCAMISRHAAVALIESDNAVLVSLVHTHQYR
jgi:hypothetical protein